MYIVLVHVNVAKSEIDAFVEAVKENAMNSNLEPGVIKFDVVQQVDEPARFILIEMYKDENAAKLHKTSEHYLKWRDEVAGMMAEPRKGVQYNDIFIRNEVV
jgi:quinol monooxygenase YgiN